MTEVNRYKITRKLIEASGKSFLAPGTELVMAEDYDRVNAELGACKTSPGGCAYWREAARLREQERDELGAELDALRSKLENPEPILLKSIDETVAEQEQLQKDADRYRWLRDANRMDGDDDGFGEAGTVGSIFVCVRPGEAHSVFGERLDKALDAAMTKDKPHD